MQSIIAHIYGGELCPGERSKINVAKFYEEKKIAVEAHNEFEEKLSEAMKKEFDEYLSKEFCLTAYHTEQAFVDGFRMGARLMLEVLEVDKGD